MRDEDDVVVAAVAEARQTRRLARGLHRVVFVMWGVLGAFHYHSSFARCVVDTSLSLDGPATGADVDMRA